MPELDSILQAIFRWFHIIAGITWIGHLYFFNFVNLPFQGGLDEGAEAEGQPAAGPARALLLPLGRHVDVPVRTGPVLPDLRPRR